MKRYFFLAALLYALAPHLPAQVEHYQPKTVLAKPLRAITNPPIVKAEDASIDDSELIIGVQSGGQARAYPINQLTGPSREIINDTLGGTAIAATW